jgi:hypothetical protein
VNEPYELLLGTYKDHPMIGTFLTGDAPAFEYLYTIIDMLSTEERIMVKVAFALHAEQQGATVRELLDLSDLMFDRVVEALRLSRR